MIKKSYASIILSQIEFTPLLCSISVHSIQKMLLQTKKHLSSSNKSEENGLQQLKLKLPANRPTLPITVDDLKRSLEYAKKNSRVKKKNDTKQLSKNRLKGLQNFK